jgi:hypothetical protein
MNLSEEPLKAKDVFSFLGRVQDLIPAREFGFKARLLRQSLSVDAGVERGEEIPHDTEPGIVSRILFSRFREPWMEKPQK